MNDSGHVSLTLGKTEQEVHTSLLDNNDSFPLLARKIIYNKFLLKWKLLGEEGRQIETSQEQDDERKLELIKLKEDNEELRNQLSTLQAKMENLNIDMKKMEQSLAAEKTENKKLCDTIKSYEQKMMGNDIKNKDQLLETKDKLIQLLEKHQK